MTRNVLITGGTTGIGAATAVAFQQAGYKVAANYVQYDSAVQKFHENTGISIYQWDVTSPEGCIEGIKAVAADIGSIDILVNNAGITRDHTLQKIPVEDWQAVINTDLGSCFNMSRAVIEDMKAKQFGRIINISSISGMAGQFGQTNYAAAKAGILGFTKALALEVAAKGVTVNAIAPGFIKTGMLGTIPDEVIKTIIDRIPVKHLGKPEDIARAILFLAADEADFITGETLCVNGGMYMS